MASYQTHGTSTSLTVDVTSERWAWNFFQIVVAMLCEYYTPCKASICDAPCNRIFLVRNHNYMHQYIYSTVHP